MNNVLENPPRNLASVRAAIYGQPWAITEAWLDQICAIVESHVAGNAIDFESKQNAQPSPNEDLGFDLVDNVAIIPVCGPIFQKANLFTRLSGATSLEDLMSAMKSALSLKPNAVIGNFDTPGGSVSGLWDACAEIAQMTASTACPMIALVNPLCASAGYALASQFDSVLSTEGGVSGGIGVIAKMDNYDRANRNTGNDPVVLRTHELKGAGVGQVTPNQQADMQRGMMAHMAKFQEAVKRGRPGVDLNEVSTGQTWMGKSANSDASAQDMELIDGISTLQKLITQYGTKS